MENEAVEVGIRLNRDLTYYDRLLKHHGFACVGAYEIRDIYYTKAKSFDGMTENQIKQSCVRIRSPKPEDKLVEKELVETGYRKVFDTFKKDYHYAARGVSSRIQIQDIAGIGLVCYYDNPDYYGFPPEKQRELLIKELNSYGFSFKKTDKDIDKLRTLYYNQCLYSQNQNS